MSICTKRENDSYLGAPLNVLSSWLVPASIEKNRKTKQKTCVYYLQSYSTGQQAVLFVGLAYN